MKLYTFEMFEKKCKEIAKEILKNKKIKYLIGVKRGGWIPVVRISHLTGLVVLHEDDSISPDKVAVIDEVLDSGRTRAKWEEYKNFYVLIDKQKEKISEWIEFWWEVKNNGKTNNIG